jgi:hypothetical protein
MVTNSDVLILTLIQIMRYEYKVKPVTLDIPVSQSPAIIGCIFAELAKLRQFTQHDQLPLT